MYLEKKFIINVWQGLKYAFNFKLFVRNFLKLVVKSRYQKDRLCLELAIKLFEQSTLLAQSNLFVLKINIPIPY